MKILETISLPSLGKKHQGKVRDYYIENSKCILVTTDRVSAFDRILGCIPYKGQVLNELSAFWFEKTKDIIQNHFLLIPDPNVMVAKKAEPISIEIVVRGYITGVTGTSIWGSYEKGERTIYGIDFPEGLKKNQKLPTPIITPTTKAEKGHDERLTRKDIVRKHIISEEMYVQMERVSLELFERGTKIAQKAGIILVDTKYEFGLLDGKLILIDELHTPDSSRFWIKKTYLSRFKKGLEPENFDKEFIRLWFKKKGYVGEGKPPKMSRELINQASKRYLSIFRKITGKRLKIQNGSIQKRIQKNMQKYLKQEKNKPLKLAVLVSNKGPGTNLQALLQASKTKKIKAKIELVISDKPNSQGAKNAKKQKIPTFIRPLTDTSFSARDQYGKKLAEYLNSLEIDIVVLAGFSTILSASYFKSFKGITLNVHPGLIPDRRDEPWKFPNGTSAPWNQGLMTEKAVANFLTLPYAGSTIHIVTEEPDFGPVLVRKIIRVKKGDSEASLYLRLKKEENKGLVEAIKKLSQKNHDTKN